MALSFFADISFLFMKAERSAMEILLGLGLIGLAMWFLLKVMDKLDDKPNCQNCPYRKQEIPLEAVEVEYETKSIRKR